MVVSIDFSYGGKPLVHRDISELAVLILGKQFQLPEPCIESSLSVFMNQGVLNRASDNGFEVLSPIVFQLKEAFDPARVTAFWVTYQPA